MALQAAIDAQGIALGRGVIVAGDLRDGRVIKPLRTTCPTGYSYYLVYPAGLPLSKSASAFCHWLNQEAANFQNKP